MHCLSFPALLDQDPASGPRVTFQPLAAGLLPPSLSDALRGLSALRDINRTAPGAARALEVGGRSIGRVELLEAAGGSLAITTAGAAAAPRVAALIQVEGAVTARQGERVAALGAGDLCLMRGARPLELEAQGPFRFVLVKAPEDEFADRFPLWRAALLTPIPGDSGVPAVFREAVTSLHRWRDSVGAAGSEGLANAVIDLMGSLVCFSVPVGRDHLKQSILQKERIKNAAQLNLRNPDLDIDIIAASVGLSPRQIHRLFADEGTSLMRWVWVQRLEQCRRELAQDDSGRRSISDIAYTWGFNDQAHFSRAFRKHFGLSPSDVRRRRVGGAGAASLHPERGPAAGRPAVGVTPG